ncbi:hypothetical protein ACVHNB_05135 [Streptomyces sp. YJ-C3]
MKGEDISALPLEQLEAYAQRPDEPRRDDQTCEAVRELAATRMRLPGSGESLRMRWAVLALAAISNKSAPSPDEAHKRAADAAWIRATMIRVFGPAARDPHRDPEGLFRDVIESARAPYADVSRMTTDWKTLSRPEILHLRRIKNTLTPLIGLEDSIPAGTPTRREAELWLSLVPRLP